MVTITASSSFRSVRAICRHPAIAAPAEIPISKPSSREARIGKIVGDFLEAQYVEVGKRAGVLDDARRLDPANT